MQAEHRRFFLIFDGSVPDETRVKCGGLVRAWKNAHRQCPVLIESFTCTRNGFAFEWWKPQTCDYNIKKWFDGCFRRVCSPSHWSIVPWEAAGAEAALVWDEDKKRKAATAANEKSALDQLKEAKQLKKTIPLLNHN